jgi:hypothetical protein
MVNEELERTELLPGLVSTRESTSFRLCSGRVREVSAREVGLVEDRAQSRREGGGIQDDTGDGGVEEEEGEGGADFNGKRDRRGGGGERDNKGDEGVDNVRAMIGRGEGGVDADKGEGGEVKG